MEESMIESAEDNKSQVLNIEPIDSLALNLIDKQHLDSLLGATRNVKIDYNGIDAKDRIGALIPLVVDGVKAADEYQHALVKLPYGLHINDLANRKTPGWEGWKAPLLQGKDGKITRQVAIKQVGLSPAMVATLGFQIATVVVGQQYMAEINKKLEKISEGIEAIQDYLEAEHNAKIKGAFRSLQSYSKNYSEYADDPEKRIAAKATLEDLRNDANVLWEMDVELLQRHIQKLNAKKYLDEDAIRDSFVELSKIDASLLATFQLILTNEKIRMQYDEDFSSKRIERVKQENKVLANEYLKLRSEAQESLRKRIDELKNFPLAFPDELEEDGYEDHHIVADAAHDIGRFFERAFAEAPCAE